MSGMAGIAYERPDPHTLCGRCGLGRALHWGPNPPVLGRCTGFQEPSDARVRDAAPELLAAIEAVLGQVIQGKVLERDACIAQARAARAKARGEA